MKRFYVHLFVVWLLSAAILLYAACNKGPKGTAVPTGDDRMLIDEAHAYFNEYVLPLPVPEGSTSIADSRSALPKMALWDKAYIQTTSIRKTVRVPVAVQEPLYIKRDSGSVSISASSFTSLLLYKDAFDQWHAEVMTSIPDDDCLRQPAGRRFTGKIMVEDWQGNYLKGFLFKKDTTIDLPSSRIFRRKVPANQDQEDQDEKPPNSTGDPLPQRAPASIERFQQGAAPVETFRMAPAAPISDNCDETDWYACSSIGDGPTSCEYEYTTEECPDPTYYSGIQGTDGTLTSGDYGNIATGGGSSGGAGTVAAQSIKPDTSITQHPNVNCVYTHLMSTSLKDGLKSILSSFDDNEVYNITFCVAPGLSGDGMTSYLGNNDFLVKINQSEADDPDFSRIYLASTFIHESFHAKLRQKALETFGTVAISEWPEPIDDMTLSELESYFEQNAKSSNIWESVEHDWMVNNIDQMATSLQEYVQTFYQTTYASVGDSLAPYEALMYMGLQNSTLYQEEVVETGKVNSFQTYWRDLNEGGKCQN